MVYVPICPDPARFQFLFGPLGYQRVESVRECPILIPGVRVTVWGRRQEVLL